MTVPTGAFSPPWSGWSGKGCGGRSGLAKEASWEQAPGFLCVLRPGDKECQLPCAPTSEPPPSLVTGIVPAQESDALAAALAVWSQGYELRGDEQECHVLFSQLSLKGGVRAPLPLTPYHWLYADVALS